MTTSHSHRHLSVPRFDPNRPNSEFLAPSPEPAQPQAAAQPQADWIAPSPSPGTAPTVARSRSKRGPFIGALVAVTTLGIVGLGAAGLIGGGAGAESPEAAAIGVLSSIDGEDVAGLVSLIDPEEIVVIDELRGALDSTSAQAEESIGEDDSGFSIDITINDGDIESAVKRSRFLDREQTIAIVTLDDLDIDVEVSGVDADALIDAGVDRYEAEEIVDSVEDVTIRLESDGDGLVGEIRANGGTETFYSSVPLQMMLVERNGRWFISIAYTLGEIVRAENPSAERPDFGSAARLVESGRGGAASREDLVDEMARAIERGDFDGFVELIDPVSVPWLHDYLPVLEAETETGDSDVRVDITSTDSTAGDDWPVQILDEIVVEGPSNVVTFDSAWCLSTEWSDGVDSRECYQDELDSFISSVDDLDHHIDGRTLLPAQPVVAVIERKGRWYIHPVRTLALYLEPVNDQVRGINWETLIEDLRD